MEYPFEPKSNTYLRSGQFWSVPLSDGRFACGRVLSVPRHPDPLVPVGRKMFLAGLLDWVSDSAPTSEGIAEAPLHRQGFAHVLTIRKTGGLILGRRPLELDGVEPYFWLTHTYGRDVWVYQGAEAVRPASRRTGPSL
jgi:hypothetical protein